MREMTPRQRAEALEARRQARDELDRELAERADPERDEEEQ